MSSDFLFVMPSFVQGVGSVLDIGGTAEAGNYNISRSPKEADIRAMTADWLAVGGDIDAAVSQLKVEVDEK
ncbi:MAG: hypothetical protein WD056_01615 [Gemmatimonadota bacterium]